ncbi:MAG: DoxX family protein [Daejeonella sp.]
MLNKYLSPQPLWQYKSLAILRIITGLLMAYHGWEVFDSYKMYEYANWDVIKTMPSPVFTVYLGKGLELVSGIFYSYWAYLPVLLLCFMAINMLFICFIVGNGKFYDDDQNPFLFAMLAITFFFTGSVQWSIDQLIFKPKNIFHSY